MHLLEQGKNQNINTKILETDEDAEAPPRRGLVCVICGSEITHDVFKTTISGSHQLRRVNPHGIEFEFSIFSAAPGCADASPATQENTWFKGFAWRISLCGQCSEHLGWHFVSCDSASFYGLLDTKLMPDPGE